VPGTLLMFGGCLGCLVGVWGVGQAIHPFRLLGDILSHVLAWRHADEGSVSVDVAKLRAFLLAQGALDDGKDCKLNKLN